MTRSRCTRAARIDASCLTCGSTCSAIADPSSGTTMVFMQASFGRRRQCVSIMQQAPEGATSGLDGSWWWNGVVEERRRVVAAQQIQPFSGFDTSVAGAANNRVIIATLVSKPENG